jgi:hypothetical protein
LIENVHEAIELLLSDVGDVLEALYFVIDEKGFDDEGDYNAFGLKAQEVYDDLYDLN